MEQKELDGIVEEMKVNIGHRIERYERVKMIEGMAGKLHRGDLMGYIKGINHTLTLLANTFHLQYTSFEYTP